MSFERLAGYMPALLEGASMTLLLTLVSVIIGMLLGLFLALARISRNKVLDRLSWFYIWLFRGTPLLLQIFFIYYTLPLIYAPLTLPQLPAALVALSLNSAAYLAEIIRAAIQSIDKGQVEAAKALGMNYGQAMRRIVIPQSYRRLIPPVGNEFIALLKDSSLVMIIGMVELMNATSMIAVNSTFPVIYIPAAGLYLLMTTLFTYFFEKFEKKYSIYE